MIIQLEEAQKLITETCDEVKELLLKKNMAYGNSVFEPVNLFASSDALAAINVRIDDKLTRLMRGKKKEDIPEDTNLDLVGYLILRLIMTRYIKQHTIIDNEVQEAKQHIIGCEPPITIDDYF